MAESSTHSSMSKASGKMIVTQAEVVSVAELKPTNINKPIKVKVFPKWTARNVQALYYIKYFLKFKYTETTMLVGQLEPF